MSVGRPILFSLSFLLVPLASSTAGPTMEVKRGDITARAVFDKDSVALSGEVVLTLTVEGPERLEVEPPLVPKAAPPRWLLTDAARSSWEISDKGLPTVANLGNGRQLWRQEFSLRPFSDKAKVEIALLPLKVKAGTALPVEINWPDQVAIAVTSSIRNADVQQLRPVTDVEAPAPAPPQRFGRKHWLIVAIVAVGAVLTLVLVVILIRKGNFRQPGVSYNAVWAVGELNDLAASNAGGPAAAGRISAVLRLYLEHRFHLPATRSTTAELLDRLRQKEDFTGGDPLMEILAFCDVAKFAGSSADGGVSADAREWCEKAIAFVKAQSVAPADVSNA
jgi:hypothetical protein